MRTTHTLKQYEPRHDKTNKMSVRPVKTQISLGIRPVWSGSSLCAQLVAKFTRFLRADSGLIRLGGCPGWSESLLGAQPNCWFCHVAAQIANKKLLGCSNAFYTREILALGYECCSKRIKLFDWHKGSLNSMSAASKKNMQIQSKHSVNKYQTYSMDYPASCQKNMTRLWTRQDCLHLDGIINSIFMITASYEGAGKCNITKTPYMHKLVTSFI